MSYTPKHLKVGDYIDSTDYWTGRWLFKIIERNKTYFRCEVYSVNKEGTSISKSQIGYECIINQFDNDKFKIINEADLLFYFL